ncbi:MAG: hypothetical protein ACLUKN_04590 [Bacilli bacterium]
MSLIYVLGAMHGNEITAMRAAGMNVFRITFSVVRGRGFVGNSVWLNADLIPFAKKIPERFSTTQEWKNRCAMLRICLKSVWSTSCALTIAATAGCGI